MGAYIRYCPACGEEYQPHMTHCLDCGAVLKERLEGEAPEPPEAPETEVEDAMLPPGEYRRVGGGALSARVLEPLVKEFAETGIPVKVESTGYDLYLSVRDEDRAAVVAVLVREGVMPVQPDQAVLAVPTEAGSCPACGARIDRGIVECPECGLLLGADSCEGCGAELSPADEACPACGRSRDGETA
jgi:double zinc ribbon protein